MATTGRVKMSRKANNMVQACKRNKMLEAKKTIHVKLLLGLVNMFSNKFTVPPEKIASSRGN